MKYIPAENILLISPIHLGDDVWRPEKDPEFIAESVRISRELKSTYQHIALQRGIGFLAASDITEADKSDDEHLNIKGHEALATAIYQKLVETGAA